MTRFLPFLFALIGAASATSAGADRSSYLDDIFLAHRYAAGKNSFHVRNLACGEKKILLDLSGPGSVRHIWSTWRVGTGPLEVKVPLGKVLLRVYLNGESRPAIEGALDELFQAAETNNQAIVPLPAFNYKRGFNLYLPIHFSTGIRIEAEPTINLDELYVQIDYRQTRSPESTPRLASEPGSNGVRLTDGQATLQSGSEGITIPGTGILRRLTFQGQGLDEQELLIFWDDEPTPSVHAPLRYFFGGFTNAAVESVSDRLTTWFPMPFRRQARIVLRGTPARQVAVSYAIEAPAQLPKDVRFFHARFREENPTVGYTPYLALQTAGAGHFVGVNLFDTGHDHGGGDIALLDAGSPTPRVLHGICGEDYFGFAWFGTERMTPLCGAPVQQRRYRLHLENPYPFNESLRFTFGTFAGRHPKSVAFWYQAPAPAQGRTWRAADVPWNVFGPCATDTALPDKVDGSTHKSNVAIWSPTAIAARWQEAEMVHGFLDLTYHFRHYAMTRNGTGAVAGQSVTRLITCVHSAEKQSLETQFGHDDSMTVSLNGKPVANLPSAAGFRASAVVLPLEKGWNKLTVTLENDENLNWRWCGLSLAVKEPAAVRFDASPADDVAFTATCDGTENRYVPMFPDGYKPGQPCDLLIALHGHGSDRWQFIRDPRDECRAARDVAAAHGMIYVSPDYRAKTSWMGPKAEADVVQIIGELKQRHRIRRMFLCGGSMGGASALTFAALHPELVDGVAAMNATANHVEFSNFQEAIAASFGGGKATVPEEYCKRSAELNSDRLTMPVGLAAGGKDSVVPPQSVLRLADALRKQGRNVLLLHREDAGHSTSYDDAKAILEFILQKAKSKP